jgi:D-lactate dehydrogenase
MRFCFFEVEGWEQEIISCQDFAKNNDIVYEKEKLDKFCLPKQNDFDIIVIFVNSRIDKEVLNYFPNLKLICTRSTGYDHIDLNECKNRNIKVAYVPGYGDNTVAEFTFGLILNLTRKIYQSIDQIKEMELFDLKNLRGIDLKDKNLGVIGTGRIGKEVIKIAKGFSMNVIAYDPFPDNDFALKYNVRYTTLDQLLKDSDIVTLHCPYSKSTHHLINQSNIKLMKKSSYLVNTARGAIIETKAVVDALKSGILAGFASDVLEQEKEIKSEADYLAKEFLNKEELEVMLYDHILMKMPNVLITPHNAFNSIEALQRILNTTIDNINGFLSNRPVNLVS